MAGDPVGGSTISVAAATVLFQPDAGMLHALLSALEVGGRRLFVYVNGPIETRIEERLLSLPNARIIRSRQNVGQGAGLNAVMTAAVEEGFAQVMLFDQDSQPEPQLIDALSCRFLLWKDAERPLAVLGPQLTAPAEGHYRLPRQYWRNKRIGTVDYVPTSGSLVSTAAWMQIGPFREEYFVGVIDVEWSLRAWDRGYACALAQDLTMVHRWGAQATRSQAWKPQILRQPMARIYLHIRNSIDCLRLAHVPAKWRCRSTLTLAGQCVSFLIAGRFAKSSRCVVHRAISDGWRGRLGPIPAEVSAL